jgi:PAS domain S-box-containing protein
MMMRNDSRISSHSPAQSPVQRITLAISAILLAVLAAYGGFFLHTQQSQVRLQVEEQGRVLARGYAAIGATALFDNLFMLQSAFVQVKHQHDILRIMAIDVDHMVVASDIPLLIGTTIHDQATKAAEREKKETVVAGSKAGLGDEMVVVFEPLFWDPEHRTGTDIAEGQGSVRSPRFAGWIRIELSLKRVQTEAWHSLLQQALMMVLLAVATIFVVGKTVRRLSQDLEQSEARLRQTIDTAHDAVVTTDRAGAIIGWNAQAETIFGWTELEALGKPLDALIFPERNRQTYRQEMARSLELNGTAQLRRRIELIAVRREGMEFPVEWSMTPIWVNNECVFSSFIRDITERKQAEDVQRSYRRQLERESTMKTDALQEVRKAKELAESASRAKSEFLALMSHEIRTPMNGILGMSELLLHTPLTAKQQHLAETVHESGTVLLKLLNDVLDLSKIESGKVELEQIRFDPAKTVQGVADLFAELAQRKGLALTCGLAASIPSVLIGDPARVRQILMNLVSNALKFTERGSVHVAVSMEEQSASHALVRFEVQDTGIGVDDVAQKKIFDSFVQADGSTARKYGGTGLGLSIVKQLAQLMEGEAGVRSQLGQGATFWVTVRFRRVSGATREGGQRLERRRDDVGPVAATQAQPRTIAGARILLAEDNQVNREVAVLMLEQLGCRIEVAEDGRAAAARMSEAAFDLVLMDCQMPVMDGFAATRAIREGEQRTGKHVPIVALTAHAIAGDRERCMAAGMDDYMSKPFTQAQLGDMIQRWLKSPEQSGSRLSDRTAPQPVEPARPSSDLPSHEMRPAQVAAQSNGTLVHETLDQLRALRRPGRPDPVAQVLKSYLDSSTKTMEAVHQALDQHNADGLFHAAHSLKSSSAMIGAMTLAKILKDFEQMGRQGNVAGSLARLAELDAAYAAVKQAVLKELGETPVS